MKHLYRVRFVAFLLMASFSFGLYGMAYAAEKKAGVQEKHAHDHSEGEEESEEHGDHKEDGHGHGKEKKKDPHSDAHDDHGEEAHGDHEEEGGNTRFGPGKAITAANKKDGIQLAAKAVKTLGLTYMKAAGVGTFRLPVKAAVFFKDEVGVYRFRQGWHKLIDVELISKSTTDVVVKTSEIKSDDQIVKEGVPLLRAAELEAWGGSGDGHGH